MLSSKPSNILEEHYHSPPNDADQTVFTNCIIADGCNLQSDQNFSIDQLPDSYIYIIDPGVLQTNILGNPYAESQEPAPALDNPNIIVTVPPVQLEETQDLQLKSNYEIIKPKQGLIEYKCIQCPETFNSQAKYDKHLLRHKFKKKYSCTECSAAFSVENNLKIHLVVVHEKGDGRCPICGINLAFQRSASLRSHLIMHQSEETLVCKQCNAEYDKEEEYIKHMTSHSSAKKTTAKGTEYPATCSYCGLEFDKIIEYREHLSYHAKLNRLLLNRSRKKSQKLTASTKQTAKGHICSTCGKGFIKRSLLVRHERIHSGERPFKCAMCDSSFTQKGSLMIHFRKHTKAKPFSCALCSAKFSQKGNLRAHVSKTHTKLSNVDEALRCPHCPCVFKRVATLNGHVTRVHSQSTPEGAIGDRLSLKEWGVMVEDEEEEEDETEESRVVGEVLKRLKQLNDGDTEPENERKVGYVTLSESFPTDHIQQRIYLVKYEKIDDVRWYFCGLSAKCNKKFKKPSDLIRHIRVHTRDKPFKCSLCSATFTLKSSLEYHTITHSYSVLKRTLKTKTKKSKFESIFCTMCDKKFTELAMLNRHISTEHYKKKKEALTRGNNPKEVATQAEIVYSDVPQETTTYPAGDPFIILSMNNDNVTLNNEDVFLDIGDLKMLQNYSETSECNKGTLTGLQKSNVVNVPVLENVQQVTDSANKGNADTATLDNTKVICIGSEGNIYCLDALQTPDCSSSIDKPEQTITIDIPLVKGTEVELKEFKKSKAKLVPRETPSQVIQNGRKSIEHESAEPQQSGKTKRSRNSCTFCTKSFKKPSDLERHLRTHTGERPYPCTLCDSSFKLKSTLQSHIKRHELSEIKVTCGVCGSFFASDASLKVHMSIHTGQKPYKCSFCDKVFRTASNRKSHETLTHLSTKRKSAEDGKVKRKAKPTSILETVTMELLNEVATEDRQEEVQYLGEQEKHTEELPIDPAQSRVGPLATSTLDLPNEQSILMDPTDNGLLPQYHLIPFNDVTLLDLDVNGDYQVVTLPKQDGLIQSGLSVIQETPVNVKPECTTCGKCYASRAALRRHQREVHEKKKAVPKSEGGNRPFGCPKCANSFAMEQGLKTHLKRIHGDTVISDETFQALLDMGLTFQKGC
ncbi:unnamed protein product [Callosobruchus maculatus]|nr:unnamed protein product [Callosobruchus maculatus]